MKIHQYIFISLYINTNKIILSILACVSCWLFQSNNGRKKIGWDWRLNYNLFIIYIHSEISKSICLIYRKKIWKSMSDFRKIINRQEMK